MAVTQRFVHAAPEDVFDVLADGWLYVGWVVGASRIRDVDAAWPEEGAKIYHSFGTWPLIINDSTSIVEWDAPHRAVIRARGWPLGEAQVTIEAKPVGEHCIVRMDEVAAEGPARWMPSVIRNGANTLRNTESLRRLAYLTEGKAGAPRPLVNPSRG